VNEDHTPNTPDDLEYENGTSGDGMNGDGHTHPIGTAVPASAEIPLDEILLEVEMEEEPGILFANYYFIYYFHSSVGIPATITSE
jgi:hypothetical protein